MGEALLKRREEHRRLRFDGHLLLGRMCLYRVHRQHVPRRLQCNVKHRHERARLHPHHHDSDSFDRADSIAEVPRAVLGIGKHLHSHHIRNCAVLHLQRTAGGR